MGTCSSVNLRRNRRQNAGTVFTADFDFKVCMSLCRSQAEPRDSKTASVAQQDPRSEEAKRREEEGLARAADTLRPRKA